ncbi:hypothetical protein M441DRAFT_41794 [Trichoderma asperellum CBS 433.97]|uniref:Uncharacterized protein n=1 Tax=Trichoderma asperellum (strain ATCC 204424 / CBS 433.97 / NBRC 101777) TaxID=1042311 RepID=A0A2T3ZM94_TRIA4|nr:hypothetical protein M441DRAFT_41794 [Trichoderma asperellum CBS 433.97]PTB45924.1 hypothetical protein M441DRAFT_41794 [Trichoderma asperellum CBS 433.97]
MPASTRKSRVGCIMCRKIFDIKSSLLSVSLTCGANVQVIKNPSILPGTLQSSRFLPWVPTMMHKSYELEAQATFFATSKPSTHHALASPNALRRDFGEQYGHLPPPSKLQHGIKSDMPAVDLFTVKLFLTPCPSRLTDDFPPSSDAEPHMNKMLFTEKTVVMHAKSRLETLGTFTLQLLKEVSQVSTISSGPTLSRMGQKLLSS